MQWLWVCLVLWAFVTFGVVIVYMVGKYFAKPHSPNWWKRHISAPYPPELNSHFEDSNNR